MNESIAVAKEVDAKKSFSSTRRRGKSIRRIQREPERQLDSLGAVIGNIARDGGTPTVESIATQMSGMRAGERAPALLALQKTHGNRYVQRVVSGIQAKLVVGQPGDKYEQEADRVADEVMRMPEPRLQRQAEEEEEEEELIQTKPLAEQITPLVQRQIEEEEEEVLQAKQLPGQTSDVTPDVDARINAIRSSGQPIPESVSTFFESRFGYNFSQARIHTDMLAAELAQAVNARAFTVGRDIVFGAGQYSPETGEGTRLLAHELVHVVQQQTSPAFIQRQRQPSYFDLGGVSDQLEILREREGLPFKLYRRPEIRRLSFSEKIALSFQRKLRAIAELGDLRHKNAVYKLVEVVENKLFVAPKGFTAHQKLLLQQEAVIALGKIGTPKAIKKLTDLLNSKNPKERLMAARGFSGASGRTMPYWHVVPTAQVGTILLAKLKQETDAGIKSQIIFALGNVGSGLSSNKEKQLIVTELIRVMEKSTGTVQTAAIKTLGRIRIKSATESLLKQLKLWHSIDAMAQEIIFALGEIGDVRAVEYLVIFLEKHGSKSVRSQAAIALGKIGGAKALAALKRRLTQETDADVKANISKALP